MTSRNRRPLLIVLFALIGGLSLGFARDGDTDLRMIGVLALLIVVAILFIPEVPDQ